MKTITVQFQAWYYTDVEVPENWEPTKDNIEALRTEAFYKADFQDGGASWEATAGIMDDESFDMN